MFSICLFAQNWTQYMSEGLEQVETLAVSNFEDEEKYLSEFDQLQRIIDMTQDIKIDLGYHERNDGKN